MQKALFLMKVLNVTQGHGASSINHKTGYPLDLAGKDTGIDNVVSPFDAIVKRIYTYGNQVWIQSIDKVQYADGRIDYAVISTTHDNSVSNLKEGQKLKQGQVYYQEGTAGNATGNHIHLETGKGKFAGNGWHQNKDGSWRINNGIPPHRLLFLNNETIIKDTGGYSWKRDEDMLTLNGINVLYRVFRHRSPTATEIKRYVNKVSFDELFSQMRKSVATDTIIKQLKAGQLPPEEFLLTEYQKAYKPPEYEEVKEQLYRRK